MWNKLLGLNSFVFWPAAAVFLLYSLGRLVLFFDWKTLVLAIVIFAILTIVEVVLAILSG